MKNDPLSRRHRYNVSQRIHRSTITLALVIFVLGIIILPWSNPFSPAFIPLILSIVISLVTLILASIRLRKLARKDIAQEMFEYNEYEEDSSDS